jgi:hypothetical protein
MVSLGADIGRVLYWHGLCALGYGVVYGWKAVVAIALAAGGWSAALALTAAWMRRNGAG